jgi:hypothetical protein
MFYIRVYIYICGTTYIDIYIYIYIYICGTTYIDINTYIKHRLDLEELFAKKHNLKRNGLYNDNVTLDFLSKNEEILRDIFFCFDFIKGYNIPEQTKFFIMDSVFSAFFSVKTGRSSSSLNDIDLRFVHRDEIILHLSRLMIIYESLSFDTSLLEIIMKKLILLLKIRKVFDFDSKISRIDSMYKEVVIINFRFKTTKSALLENFLIFENYPYKLIYLSARGKRYPYVYSCSIFTSCGARILSPNNNNIINKNLDSVEILGSFPIKIDGVRFRNLLDLIKTNVNKQIESIKKDLNGAPELENLNLFDASLDWWSSFNSKTYYFLSFVNDEAKSDRSNEIMKALERDKSFVMKEIRDEINSIINCLLKQGSDITTNRQDLIKKIKSKAFIKEHRKLTDDLCYLLENKKILEEQIKVEELK